MDFRKGMGPLAVRVEQSLRLDSFAETLYVFTNPGDAVKCLYWDADGFRLRYKRLEQEGFEWPWHLGGAPFATSICPTM